VLNLIIGSFVYFFKDKRLNADNSNTGTTTFVGPMNMREDSRCPCDGYRKDMAFDLEDLLESEHLENLFDAFYTATGMSTAIISLDGKTEIGSVYQKICSAFHHRHPESLKICAVNDIRLNESPLSPDELTIHRCPHGLINAAIPVIIDGRHMANLFTGQFFYDAPDAAILDRFRKLASQWGFDEQSYVEALLAVPVIPEKRVEPLLEYLKQMAEMIAHMGLDRLRLREKDKAIDRTHAALQKEIRQRRAEAKKLNQILEGSPMPTFVVDADRKISHWNRACELLTNIPAKKIIGTDRHRETFYDQRRELMADLIVRQASTCELSAFYGGKYKVSQQAREGYEGEDFFPLLGNAGKWLSFTAAPIKGAAGRILGAIETLQDITGRKTAEQELRASESRYRQLFESANDAIFILKNEQIVDCNRKALELFNRSRKAMLGLSPLDLSPDIQPDGTRSTDEVRRRVQLLQQDVPQFFEWRFLRKNGSPFEAEVSLNRLMIADAPHGLAIIRNVTKRNAMIRDLEDREKELEDKSNYLEKVNQALKASLDHREVEKRAVEETMLVNLKRFVFPYLNDLEKCDLGAEARAYLNIIDTNLNDIVSQFSNTIFSKYIDLTPTEVRIADFIREGKNSKAIANTLALSPSSIQWHRKNIRQKLGLTNKKVNLHTYLNSLGK
jgi:PAS domain S-box-containing protein